MNPYHSPQVNEPKSATDLFGQYKITPKGRKTERGELLKYFAQKTKRDIKFIAYKCTGLSIQDLYYIKSSADRYENEGKGAWGKAFFGMLKIST